MEKYTLTARRIGLSAVVSPLATLGGIILLPILTKNLPIEVYGSWALVMVTIGLLPPVVTLGLPHAMVRFGAAARDDGEIRELFYSLGAVVLVASLLVSGLLFLLVPLMAASLLQNNLTTALLLIPNVLISCLSYFIIQYFIAFQQIKRHSVIIVTSAFLNTVLIAFFVLSGHGLEGAITALLIQQLVVFSVMLFLIIEQIGVAVPKFTHVRQHLAYGLPLIPGILSNWVVNSSDRYLIALFLGAAAVGYYSPGYNAGAALSMIAAPLVVLLPAILSKHYDEDNFADVRTIMTYSLKYYAGIVIPSVFALSVLSKPLLTILTTQQIAANGYLVTPFVAAGTALLGAYSVLSMPITLRKKTFIAGTIWTLSAVLNFGVNLVLIPYVGLIGAAIATFLAFLFGFVVATLYSRKFFMFDMNGWFIVKSVCGSGIIALFLLLWNPSGLVSILLSVALAAVIYLVIVFALRGFTLQEIKLIYRIYRGY
jgi:O-antigen/teichoic acid export membrane protein